MEQVLFLGDQPLSAKALDLVHFDRDSILQAAAGRRGVPPVLFVGNPELYERNGRALRDSEIPRLLAFSPEDNVVYANDGCNSCTHELHIRIGSLDDVQLREFAKTNNVPVDLLTRLAQLVR